MKRMDSEQESFVSRRSIITAMSAAVAGSAVALPAVAEATPDPILALIEAHRAAYNERREASAARDDAEAALDLPPGWAIKPEHERRWQEDSAVQAAVDRSTRAMYAEEEAFSALLRSAPTASPAGFRELAEHTCELTCNSEGLAGEGASYAYRALAALVGRHVWLEFDEDGNVIEDEEV